MLSSLGIAQATSSPASGYCPGAGSGQVLAQHLPRGPRALGLLVRSPELGDVLADLSKGPPLPVQVERILVQRYRAQRPSVLVPAGPAVAEHHPQIALAGTDQRRVPVHQPAVTGGI